MRGRLRSGSCPFIHFLNAFLSFLLIIALDGGVGFAFRP